MRPNANWKVRRRYVAMSWGLGAGMVVLGALAVFDERIGAGELITGGVALVTIVLGTYVGGAVADDRLQKRSNPDG